MQVGLGILSGVGIGFFLATLLWKLIEKDPVLLMNDIGGVIQNTVKETSQSIVQALWNPTGDKLLEAPPQATEHLLDNVEDIIQEEDLPGWLRPADESWGPGEVPDGEPAVR